MQSEDKKGTAGAKSGVVSLTLLIGKVSGLNYFQNCRQVLFQREQIHSFKKRGRERINMSAVWTVWDQDLSVRRHTQIAAQYLR